uniref:Uncharacterized protein n=1 Tax=Cyanothece sp. (strain PCC 7425 / ATCC 29141) TaxID=395961 RepID=B8HXM2_CYAP4
MAKKDNLQNQQDRTQDIQAEEHEEAERQEVAPTLAAEAEPELERPSTTSKAAPAERQTDLGGEINAFLEFLQTDPASIDLEAAQSRVNDAYELLHRSKQPEVKEISSGLRELKKQLQSNKATGHDLAELLEQIGEQTSDMAAEADKGLRSNLKKLGRQLTKLGHSVSKAEDQERLEQLNSLVDLLEEDLDNLDPQAAIAPIDHWYALLHRSDNEQQQQLANSLKELKQALKSNKARGALPELLIRVGEQTTAIAAEAGRGFKRPIQRVGKLLNQLGKSLEEEE